MKPVLPTFPLPPSEADARALQETLRHKLVLTREGGPPQTIGGVDVGYDVARGLAHASVVTMEYATLEVREQVQVFVPVDFPYIPGLLSFREIPAILVALDKLRAMPEVLMVDGHGIAHPRRMGIAAHLGVHIDWPTFGVAKNRLTGKFTMPGPLKGDRSPLMSGTGPKAEQIGTVLRSKDNINPLFISPGHRMDMASAVDYTLHCLRRHKLPEPTRLADKLSKCS